VKNEKENDKHGASDAQSDSENNSDDSSDAVVPTMSKMPENINEVIIWLGQQTHSEHLHLLHLVNIKQYYQF
jgi:hypothetical protein